MVKEKLFIFNKNKHLQGNILIFNYLTVLIYNKILILNILVHYILLIIVNFKFE